MSSSQFASLLALSPLEIVDEEAVETQESDFRVKARLFN